MTAHTRRIRLVSDAVVAAYIREISATAQPVTIEMPKPGF